MTTVLPDRPISAPAEDFLDRDAFAQNIADLILHAPPQGSLRIGVYGGWGEGKTSVLKLIHGHLCDAGHVCVWLTPWISSNREEVVEQLVRAIAAELKIDIDKLDVAKGTVQLAERLRKPAAEINIKFKLAESVFGPIVQRYLNKKAAEQWHILLSEIEKGLSGRKLIVFVDDLDRVRPELVPNMLLTLREGLDQPDYFYVMALAPEVIERGLKMVHEGWGGPREFLEKIVELPKYLPRPTAEERHRFTSALLQTLGSSMDAEAIMDLAPLLSDNPRKLKLFLRYIASLKGLLSRFSPGELDWRTLYLCQMLRLEFPDESRALMLDTDTLQDIELGWAKARTGRLFQRVQGSEGKENDNRLERQYAPSDKVTRARFLVLCDALRQRGTHLRGRYRLADLFLLPDEPPILTLEEVKDLVAQEEGFFDPDDSNPADSATLVTDKAPEEAIPGGARSATEEPPG